MRGPKAFVSSALTRDWIKARVRVTRWGCWEWGGTRTAAGYGRIRIDRRTQFAHRVIWKFFRGAVAGDLQVCHHCDNPPCCNPAHLFVGDGALNRYDSDLKRRSKRDHSRYWTPTAADCLDAYLMMSMGADPKDLPGGLGWPIGWWSEKAAQHLANRAEFLLRFGRSIR